jgi:hypothetical protein
MQWCRISSGGRMSNETIRVRAPIIGGRKSLKSALLPAQARTTADRPEPSIAHAATARFA